MTHDIDKLRADYEKAEQRALDLQAERDGAKDKFQERLQAARDKAAAAQKLLLDAEVHAALESHPDREAAVARMRAESEQFLTANLAARSTRPDGTFDNEGYEAGVAELRERATSLGYDHLPFYRPAE